MKQPVDGYTVEWDDDEIRLIFTDRFGEGDVYRLPPRDAAKIAAALQDALTTGNFSTVVDIARRT
jgi:hypothetical protein